MVDLKAKPFYLNDEDIQWVNDTLDSLSLDEKIGQLFMDMIYVAKSEEDIKSDIEKYGMSGFRYGNRSASEIYDQNAIIQKYSKIPALIAANIEAGGNGCASDGTLLGNAVSIGATGDEQYAYNMGYYGCKEAAAVGCTWSFAPVTDILYNWRNCVVSERSFGNDPDTVLRMARAYMRGANDAGIACCTKHYPGDGLDERDQHIVTTINSLSCEEWDESFGKVYKGLIDDGIPSLMVGHIQLPSYSRKLRPGIKDQDIMPATVAEELLKDLLRDRLRFNGVVITDATHMVGLTAKMKRSEFIPGAIEAGCDLILYYRDKDEDIQFMHDGIKNGLVSMERIDEAVTRVLAFKAMLKLHIKQKEGTLLPPKEGISCVGSPEHWKKAKEIYDRSITLVKNTRDQLPITPETHPRIMLYGVYNELPFGGQKKNVRDMMKDSLEAAGFKVSTFDTTPDQNGRILLSRSTIGEFVSSYDAVIVVASVNGFSQSNERRLHWKVPMGPDIPWYVTELPTVFISLANPFHLIDVPMVPTFINAYNENEMVVDLVVEKIMGRSEFKGTSPVDAFCDAWDTRL
jgi:beta-N-acetylhexosaminidase